ncbi:DUF1850 domain-containing protein [Sporosarcina sp. OR05]|uniref:DUF1850 domain-containing protein n=1 Tax=Sporosarcina sp. OR05 TaxID=2969819 RepID=UPI00352B2DAA
MSRSKILVSGGIVVMLLLSLFLLRIPAIQVDYPDGRFYLMDTSFDIGWIHSVEKEPWFETYERDGDQLTLTTTKFKTFGAGVPASAELIEADDGFIHMTINEQMKEINLAVSSNVQTTLYTKNNEIPLYELADEYETVNIHAEKVSIWNLVRGEKID